MRQLLEHTTDNPLTPQVQTRALPLHFSVSLFNSGLGAGITRPLRLDVTAGSLVPPPRLLPAWQPNWESVKTIGVQFVDVPEPAPGEPATDSGAKERVPWTREPFGIGPLRVPGLHRRLSRAVDVPTGRRPSGDRGRAG